MRECFTSSSAEHFGLDTKVARTLATLVRRPGTLTTEFLAGRRMRYIPPLRLYLSLSVLFFLLSSLQSEPVNGRDVRARVDSTQSADSADARSAIDSLVPAAKTKSQIADTLHGNEISLYFKRRLVRRVVYFKAHKTEAVQRIAESFHHKLPDALFLLVPGLALALAMLYNGSGRYYVDHLVFALHFQAFSFAALTIGLIPLPMIGTVTGLAILVYLYLAMRNVYGGSALATVGKATIVVIGYGISLALIMAASACSLSCFPSLAG